MPFKQWMQQRRLRRFIVRVPIWTISYLIVSLICHWVFRWEFRWAEVVFWGLCMATIYTFRTPGNV